MGESMIDDAVRPAELLLVEDNYGDVLLTREALKSATFVNNISVAGDGEEALSMLRAAGSQVVGRKPDLILLDLNLPRTDGREVLRALKADPGLREIPVIVLAGSSADVAALETDAIEADGYIAKPIDPDRLKEIMGSIESLRFAVGARPAVAEANHG